jgi:hypothetical protein
MSRDSSVNNENGCGLDDGSSIPSGRDILPLGTLRPDSMFVVGEPALVARIPLPAFGLQQHDEL